MTPKKSLVLLLALVLPFLEARAASGEAKKEENPINVIARELKADGDVQTAAAERIYGFMWKDYVESSVKKEKDNGIRLRAAVQAWVEQESKQDASRLGVAQFYFLLRLDDSRTQVLVMNMKAWSGTDDPAEGFIFSKNYLAATETVRWIKAFLADAVAQSHKILTEPRRIEETFKTKDGTGWLRPAEKGDVPIGAYGGAGGGAKSDIPASAREMQPAQSIQKNINKIVVPSPQDDVIPSYGGSRRPENMAHPVVKTPEELQAVMPKGPPAGKTAEEHAHPAPKTPQELQVVMPTSPPQGKTPAELPAPVVKRVPDDFPPPVVHDPSKTDN